MKKKSKNYTKTTFFLQWHECVEEQKSIKYSDTKHSEFTKK